MLHWGRHGSKGTPLRRLKQGIPKKGEAALLPRGEALALSPIATFAQPTIMRPTAPERAAKPVLKKHGGATLLAKKRAYTTDDE